MNENIRNISKNLENLASVQSQIGLRKGITGISLFFFHYARFTQEDKYEELANRLLEKVLAEIPNYNSYLFATEFANIGQVIDFLTNEQFLEVDLNEFTECFEKPLILRIRKDVGVDFSFSSGVIGICNFFLNRVNQEEALDITMKHLYSGLQVKGYPNHPIESLFLFPSEVLRDVKIFLLKLESMNITFAQKELLYETIQRKELRKEILQSNCPEYTVLQDLREAEIVQDKQRTQFLLEVIARTSSNLVFKGLASMSLEETSLPAWWKLI